MEPDIEEALRKELNRQDRKGRQDLLEPSKDADDAARAVIGAAIEVHRHLGPGFLESIYEQALAVEFGLRSISFRRQTPLGVLYKGHSVGEGRLDFVIENCLVVELKVVDSFTPIHRAQLCSYLNSGGYQLGLLINFKVRALREGIRRVIWNP